MDFTISDLYIACDDIDNSEKHTVFYVHDNTSDYIWWNPAEGFIYRGIYENMPLEIQHSGVDRFKFMPDGTIRVLLYRRNAL